MERSIKQRVEIYEMQCGFMSCRCKTDAMLIVHQLHEKQLAAKKPLYATFSRHGKSICSCSKGCHLVGNAQTMNRHVAGAISLVYVQRSEKHGKSRRWIQ